MADAFPTGALSARVVRRMVDHCSRKGFDSGRLCSLVGLPLEILQDLEARVPFPIVEELGKQVLNLTGDADLGLHLAEGAKDQEHYDVGLLLLLSSPNLGSALEHFVSTQDYWGDGQRATLETTEEGVHLRYHLPTRVGVYARHAAECALAEVIIGAEVLVGHPVQPKGVRFRHPRPGFTATHERIFGICPEFDAEHNEVLFGFQAAQEPLRPATHDFFSIFAGQVEVALARLDRTGGTASDVRTVARATLGRGGPSLSDIARILRTSPRTLQRRLHEEGTSFVDVIETLRQELAHLYLKRQTPIGEVATLLGYADASAFCHAFRRWTVGPPTGYRLVLDQGAHDRS